MTNTKYYINGVDGIESISEEFGRARCGLNYEVEFANGKSIFLDLNHKILIKDNQIHFEKKKDFEGEEWDYNKRPIEDPVIHYYPTYSNNNHVDNLISLIRKAYTEYENRWKAGN
jgi:hypothetical protein